MKVYQKLLLLGGYDPELISKDACEDVYKIKAAFDTTATAARQLVREKFKPLSKSVYILSCSILCWIVFLILLSSWNFHKGSKRTGISSTWHSSPEVISTKNNIKWMRALLFRSESCDLCGSCVDECNWPKGRNWKRGKKPKFTPNTAAGLLET